MLKLNETPVRTSRNFNINNIKLDGIDVPQNINAFNNANILVESEKISTEMTNSDYKITYGISDELIKQVKEKANYNLKVVIDNKVNKNMYMNFELDSQNNNLLENIEIIANENSKSTIYIKYKAEENIKGYHNGILKLYAKSNSTLNIVFINLFNENTNNFISIDGEIEDNAKINYTIIDFGGKNSITNLYSNLIGENSDNEINTIYLGRDEQILDINYIGELRGKKSNIDIEVQGALKDNAKKHFKGTIDFKKGCKKATGDENEFCTLLSDKAKSIALPMLLCSEDDVEGNHSTASGKIGEKELFYIMSRGFDKKSAMKLIVRAKFNKIIEKIDDENIKNEIIDEMNKRLD